MATELWHVNTYIVELVKIIGYADSILDSILIKDWVLLGWYSVWFIMDFIFYLVKIGIML